MDGWDWKKFGVLVAKNEVSYLKPVLLNDVPHVEVLLESIGTKSFSLAYEITVNGELTTTGRSVMVCFDVTKQASVEISQDWKDALNKLRKVNV